MGLFDAMLAGSKQEEADKIAQRNALKYQSLLEQQRADAGNNNPYTATIGQPQGILESGGQSMPTPAQFMDLATIPGYEQFGLNAQQNAATTSERVAGQDYAANNMSLAQRTTAEQNLAQMQQQQDQFEAQQAAIKERFESLSPYEKAVLEANKQAALAEPEIPPFIAAGGKVGADQQLTPDGTGLMNAPGGKLDQEAQMKLDDLVATEAYFDALDNVLELEGTASSGSDLASIADSMITSNLGPAYSILANTGAQNLGDIDTIKSELAWELNAPIANTLQAMLPGDQLEQARTRSQQSRQRFRDKARSIARAAGLPEPTYKTAEQRLAELEQLKQDRLARLDAEQNGKR